MYKPSFYSRFTTAAAHFFGRPLVFLIAVILILFWLAAGSAFGFSVHWLHVVDTTTAIFTFLMVFIIQNTQNRDSEAMQIKLDELIRVTRGAHNALLDLEDLEEDELEEFRAKYRALASEARKELDQGEQDTGTPDT